MPTREVDVLICGGGPVGLLIGYCLARYGLSTYIIEQHSKATQEKFGRAAMIAPRSLEMLEQLDLADPLGQIGFVARGQVAYKDGVKVDGVRAYSSSDIKGTFYDYLLLIRQKYTEGVMRDGLKACGGGDVGFGCRLVGFEVGDGAGEGRVRSTVETAPGQRLEVVSKFIVGADGSRSTVREMADIPFEGEKSTRVFIRIDGVVKTDMLESRRGLAAVYSKSHGTILWACLDHGRTRVGYLLPAKLHEELEGDITQDVVIREAKKALEPFTLEFEVVDWWTAYAVGQRLAKHYRVKERIFLAGDAAHTHSSAAAQGMNTGIHDAVNLSWKLAGHIKGFFMDSVIDSYETERRQIGAKVIEQDKMLAILHSGEVPEQYKDNSDVSAQELLDKLYASNEARFVGIAIAYPADNITTVEYPNLKFAAGMRAPDVLVQNPGMNVPIRLFTLFKNIGKFTILVFSGDPSQTNASLQAFRKYIDGAESIARYSVDLCQYLTILHASNENCTPDEKLGIPRLGSAFYDVDGSAHERYGVPSGEGQVIVLRPDGTIGTACGLDGGVELSAYFAKFMKAKKVKVDDGTSNGSGTPLQGMADIETQDCESY